MSGVSAEFFSKAIAWLVRQHGNRNVPTDGRMEDLRKHLEDAETLFLSFDETTQPERKADHAERNRT